MSVLMWNAHREVAPGVARNVGDEALLRITTNVVAARSFGRLAAKELANDEISARGVAGRFVARARMIHAAEGVIVSGGTLVADDRPESSIRGHPFQLALLMLTAHVLGKQVHLLGVGAETVASRFKRIVLRFSLNRATHVSVRDSDSLERVKRLAPRAKVSHGSDMFLLTARMEVKPLNQGVYALRRSELEVFLDRGLIADGSTVIAMDFADVPHSGETDFQIPESVSVVRPRNWMEAYEKISGADYVIASRMHALYFALPGNVPSLAISAYPKVESFCAEFGVPSVRSTELSSVDAMSLLRLPAVADRSAVEAARARGLASIDEVVESMVGS